MSRTRDDGTEAMSRCPDCRASIEQRLGEAGVPENERGYTFETSPAQVRRIASTLSLFVESDRLESVVLLGPVGTGKTGLGVATLRAAIASGWSVGYVWLPGWLRALKGSFADSDRETEAVFARVTKPKLVLLDELGTRAGSTDFAIDTLYELLHERQGARTIVTTNLTSAEVGEIYGARVASRLKPFVVLKVDGQDLRERRGR